MRSDLTPLADSSLKPLPVLSPAAASPALAIIIVALTIASASAMGGVFSPLQEMAKLELRLTDFQISLIQGLAGSLPLAFLSIPIGRLADRSARVRLLLIISILWTLGTALSAVVHSFALLFIARMLARIGSVATPVAVSLIADVSRPERRGRALLLLMLGVSGGNAVAFALGGWLTGVLAAESQPWRGVLIAFAAGSAILVLPLFLLREPTRREVSAVGSITRVPVLRELWNRRAFLGPLFVGQIGVMMADIAAGIWASPVLIRDHGLKPAEFGGWMGLVFLVSGMLGSIAGGYLADLGQALKMRGGLLLVAVAAAALSIPAAFFPLMPTIPGFAILLTLLLLCGAITGLVTTTAVAVLIPNELRGLCFGALIAVSSIVAIGIAPTLVTLLASALGGETHVATALTVSGVIVSTASVFAFVLAMRRMPSAKTA